MHREIKDWFRILWDEHPGLFHKRRVLECGSRMVLGGGTVSNFFADCDYTGLDALPGPGVDVISLAHEYWPEEPYDVVVCCQMLEHDPHWRKSVTRMAHMTNDALILTFPDIGWPAHGDDYTPQAGYYENPDWEEVLALLSPHFEQLECTVERLTVMILATGRKECDAPAPEKPAGVGEQYTQLLDTWSDIQAHLPFLEEQARGNVLELGTRGGVSTVSLLAGVERHGGNVWSVDINPNCGKLFQHCQWSFINADSRDVETIKAAGVPDDLDVLFLDTEHTYEQVMSELDAWGDNVRRCIIVHDTELYPGVKQAVVDWAEKKGQKAQFWPKSNGLGAIRRVG